MGIVQFLLSKSIRPSQSTELPRIRMRVHMLSLYEPAPAAFPSHPSGSRTDCDRRTSQTLLESGHNAMGAVIENYDGDVARLVVDSDGYHAIPERSDR